MKIQDLQDFEVISGGLQQPQKQDGFSIGKTIKNIPSSAGGLIGGVISAIRHPVATTKGLGEIVVGGVEKLIPGEQKQEKQFDAVVNFFKDRYGGVENIKKTVQEDPVGFLLDVSTVFTAGGTALSKIPQLAKVGQAVKVAGLATEPLTLLGKGLAITTSPIRKVLGIGAREALGVTTGVGGEAIKEAFRNPTKEFTEALRGKTTANHVLTGARDALGKLKDQRASAYKSQLSKIKVGTEKLVKPFKELKQTIDKKLNEFNVKINPDETLDFSKSVIADSAEAKRIAEFVEEIRKWKDTSPTGLDILKQRLDDFYSTSGRGRALTTAIASDLRNLLNKNVEGYAKMTTQYAETTNLIKEIENTLSLKQGARIDTTIKKLTSALRQNQEFRKGLVEQLDALTKQDLIPQLAGVALSPGVPAGLIGRSLFAGGLSGGLAGLAGLAAISPKLLFGLAFTSPRVVGELLRALGMSSKAIESVLGLITSPVGKQILQGGFQAGRAVNQNQANEALP